MFRLISRILMIVGSICFVWLLYGLITGTIIPSFVIIGVLLFVLGVLFKDRDNVEEKRGVKPPSQRKNRDKHQSWISRDQ